MKRFGVASSVLILSIVITACQQQDDKPPAASLPPPVVTVVAVTSRDVTPSFEQIGRIEAVNSVELRARVEGYLEKRAFQEGADVKQGELLFQIERAPYEAVVDQRKADLARAKSVLSNAQTTLKRNQNLRKKGTVSQATLDDAGAAAAEAKAGVLQAEAALRSAQLNLDYTQISSPVAGRIGRAALSAGNLVGPNSGALATVVSLDPIYVIVAVSDKDLIEARKRGIDLETPRVEPALRLADGTDYAQLGRFDFLDNQVNQGTDTVTARAVFANPDEVLLPGQFVTVVIKQKEAVSALVVPQAAIQENQSGRFVLVVKQDNTVEARPVTTGQQVDSEWVIEEGLTAGEQVIVQGLQKVRPGLTVNPVSAQADVAEG